MRPEDEPSEPAADERGSPPWLVEPDSRTLARSSARSGALTSVAQLLNLGVGIGSQIVLARLLAPEDFGLVAMVSSLGLLILVLQEFGIAQALVQRENLKASEVHGVLKWSLLAAGLMLALFIGAAPVFAWFYDEPRVFEITLISGAVAVVGAFTTVPKALLMRGMRFGVVSGGQTASLVVASVAAIVAAALGAGYWALIVQQSVSVLVMFLIYWFGSGYVPSLSGSLRSTLSLVSFGASFTGNALLQRLAVSADNVIIGRVNGPEPLGQYTMAYRILLTPILKLGMPATQVALPTLSRLQDDPERYRRFYRFGVLLVASVGMPLVCVLGLFVQDFVPLLLGDGWDRTVGIFRLLSIPAFIWSFSFVSSWAFVSCGEVKRQFKVGLITSPTLVVSYLIGARWGPEGVAGAFAIALTVTEAFKFWYCYRHTIPTFADLLGGIARPATAALSGVVILLALAPLLGYEEAHRALRLSVGIALFGAIYGVLWLGLPGGFSQLRMIKNTFIKPRPGEGAD